MKQNKFYLLAAATALLLSACNNEEVPGTQESDLARFTGSIEGVKTRAYDTTWENGDQIGITGTSGWETYTNMTYNWNASGYFTADQKDIYYNTPEDVAFTAYYPWKTELSSSTSYDFNTDAQSQQKTFDFLYATGTGSKYEPEVEFNFTHCMSKLSFIVKAGADVTLDEVKAAKYSLRSFLNNGTFDRVTGKVNAAGSVLTAPWAFANSSIEADNAPSNVSTERNSVTYNLILVPQTFESHLFFTASVLLDGINLQEFYANIDFSEIEGNGNVNEMKPGYQYNVTVNVNKTGLSVGKCEITPWTELSGSIEATM